MTMQIEQADVSSAGQQAIQLLSAIPYFDFETGTEIVSLLERDLDSEIQSRWAADLLFELVASGALESVRDLHRVPASIRDNHVEQILSDDLPAAQRAINIFVDRARGKLRNSLAALMGIRAARVTIETLDAIANPDQVKKFDLLVDTVHRSSRLGRVRDSFSVAKLIQTYSSADDRRVLFMNGLSCWQTGNRSDAARYFREVLSVPLKDHAEGVSAHLLGVYEHDRGNSNDSLKLLTRAEKTLKKLGDFRGLAITETSHGRILRELARPSDDNALRERSLKLFRSARASHERAGLPQNADVRLSRGRIDLGEGQTLFDLGEYEDGIRIVEQALGTFPVRSEESLWARIALAGMYRDHGQPFEGVAVLSDWVKTAERNDRRDMQIAIALNVLASAERRIGRLDDALEHAMSSVEIGNELELDRHLGHALLTLALIEIDMLNDTLVTDGPTLRRIRSHLYRSRVILKRVHDNTRLPLIEEALRGIHSKALNRT